MLKKLGIKKQYLRLLALRLPFEAVRNLINALFLKQAFEAIEALDFVRLGLVCGLFLFANLFLPQLFTEIDYIKGLSFSALT